MCNCDGADARVDSYIMAWQPLTQCRKSIDAPSGDEAATVSGGEKPVLTIVDGDAASSLSLHHSRTITAPKLLNFILPCRAP